MVQLAPPQAALKRRSGRTEPARAASPCACCVGNQAALRQLRSAPGVGSPRPAPAAGHSQSPVLPTDPGATTPPAPAGCSADTLKANLVRCDGGTDVWNKAKAAAGRDPSVTIGSAAGGFGGHADLVGGGVVISPNPDCCGATQTFVFELTNLSSKARFVEAARQAAAGDLDREAYARAEERIEYDSGLNSVRAFGGCKQQWGCAGGAVARHGFIAHSTDFDDYYTHHLVTSHKDYYRNYWDTRFKTAYDAKHPH